MSTVSHRQRVTQVTQQVREGLRSICKEIRATRDDILNEQARHALQQCRPDQQANPNQLNGTASMREERAAMQQQLGNELEDLSMTPVDAVQAETVGTLEAASCQVAEADLPAIRQSMAALRQAQTIGEAQELQQQVFQQVDRSHHTVVTENLALACEKASMAIGFSDVQVSSGRGDTALRVIATDPAGRSLVSEIRAGEDDDPQLATEVVGVLDGSCNEVMDAFDEALEEEGVRSAGPPEREFTGNVCELAAAREFMRRKVQKKAEQKKSSSAKGINKHRREQRRRAQQNQSQHQ